MLDVRSAMTLDLERTWWKYAGAKDQVIRDLFSETPIRYAQRLNALLDQPEALAYAPDVVRRLQRLRDQRKASRSGYAVPK